MSDIHVMGDSGYSCCPRGAVGPDIADTTATSHETMYHAPAPHKKVPGAAALVFHDIYGFNSGGKRQKRLCDELAACLCVPVYMPDLFDGKPPIKESNIPLGGLAFYAQVPFAIWKLKTNFDPDKVLKTTLDYVKARHGRDVKIILVGLCFGFWVMTQYQYLKENVLGAVGFHPSLLVSELRGPSEEDIAQNISYPTLMITAENDSDKLKPGGKVALILQEKFPGEEVAFEIKGAKHGFMARGNETNDTIKKAQDAALHKACDFLGDKMQPSNT